MAVNSDNVVRAISKNGGAYVIAIDSTEICREMERLHKTSATASAALGRLLTGAALCGLLLKSDDEKITLRVDGKGPVGALMAVCDASGHVKGCCDNPLADLPLNKKTGKLDVGGLVGTDGTFTYVKSMDMKEPYRGSVPLVSGEIAEDITSYFALSEQIPTVCALGVLVNPDLTIKAAGGFILQLLPGATEEEISLIEKNIAEMGAVTPLIDRGDTPKEIAFAALNGFEPDVLDEQHVVYRCDCSYERVEKTMISLGREELSRLADEQQTTEVVCAYCNKKYEFSSDKLFKLSGEI